jgi:hypothetical protein
MLKRWDLRGLGSFEEKRMAPHAETPVAAAAEQQGLGLKPDAPSA